MFVTPLSERRKAGFSGLMRRPDTEPPFVSAGEKRHEAQEEDFLQMLHLYFRQVLCMHLYQGKEDAAKG